MRLQVVLSFVCLALFGAVPAHATATYLEYTGEEFVVPDYPFEFRIGSHGTGYFDPSITDGDIALSDLSDFKFITHLVYKYSYIWNFGL